MSAQPATSRHADFRQPEDRLGLALDRLRRAADALESALARQERETKSIAALEQEMEALLNDRSKLAHELDQVKARASRLDAAGAEVSGRLDAVMSNLQSVLSRG